MKQFQRSLVLITALLLVSLAAYGQVTGTLTGTVNLDGKGLPGVTVSISSPAMQGVKTTYTSETGNYSFPSIPPGLYTVKFEMEGMQTVTKTQQVGLAQTARANADMKLSAVAEAITVTASAPAVLETTEVQSNVRQELINSLPTGRTVIGIALLAPGTAATGPRSAIVISGATADQNLITVDGANIQENLRGQTHGLFIEDAIQETTVLTGSISAEYGRFTGGVVNSITKSGGNEFSGSYRDNLTNPAWTLPTDYPGDKRSARVWSQVHEATFGGRIVRDRLWFFGAGRKTKSTATSAFALAGGPTREFSVLTDAKRYEGKLTGQITPKHSLVATYLKSPLDATNNCQLGCLEMAGIDPAVTQGNDFWSGHYNGILTNNWLVEALYSRKTFTFIGFGGENRDPVAGSPLFVFQPGGASYLGVANAPYFCGVCDQETRNNNSWTAKSTYFWSSKAIGTHNIVAGYEKWAESRFSNNYQSPTNFVLSKYADTVTRDPNTGVAYFDLVSGVDWVVYYPILTPSLGSNLRTNSAYVNDKWDLSAHWNFNVGVRYDKNDALNSLHQTVSKDSGASPRLGVNYDVFGDGRLRATAGYNVYVGRLAEGVTSGSSAAGTPASFYYQYMGPDKKHLTSREYSQAFFTWFNSVGGINNKDLIFYQNIPGTQSKIAGGSLKSPNVTEFTVGAGGRIGNGYVRGDLIDRKWKNFYVNKRTTAIGTIDINGEPFDLNLIANSDIPERTYKAFQMQGQYQLFNKVQLGGNYTYSKLEGNIAGENTGSGPISDNFGAVYYPEYNGFDRNHPSGLLPADQTHKVRLWASYDLVTFLGKLNVGAIQRYDSGNTYSAIGSVSASWYVSANPGYVSPPGSASYYFSDRGAFRTQALNATDLSSTFTFPSLKGLDFYVSGFVTNVFNTQKVTNYAPGASAVINTSVRTARTSGSGLKKFNPFTDKPVECPKGNTAAQCSALNANWQLGPLFGKPTSKSAYQTPRTYSMAAGFRF